jgi:hypothetical protein
MQESPMINEHELAAAIVTVEQSIRDSDAAKKKFKQDGARLAEFSTKLLIDRTKLQVLHFAQGIQSIISPEELHSAINDLQKALHKLSAPVETNLFSVSEPAKEQERIKLIYQTKLFALQFVSGDEKKIV